MTIENTVQTTLNAWQAQLEDIRRRRIERGGGHAGLAKPHQVLGKTGLQVMTALLGYGLIAFFFNILVSVHAVLS